MAFLWYTTNRDLLEEIMAQIDDLTAAVAAANTALAALQARDATVAAGVTALQAEVTALEAQLAGTTNPPDLSGITAQVNALAAALAPIQAAVGGIDVSSVSSVMAW